MSAEEQRPQNIPGIREEMVDEEKVLDTNNGTRSDDLADCVTVKKRSHYKNIVHLWEFLLELLADDSCRSLIVWSRQAYGEFKLKDQEEVAKRWGRLKCRPKMNYEKLSRALRHYYTQGIIKKVPGQRLVYKFHKLPYEYTPRMSISGRAKALATFSAQDQEERHEERAICSEQSPTDRDKLKYRLLQEIETRATSSLDTPNYSEKNEEGRDMPFASDKLPSAVLFPSGGASAHAGCPGCFQTQIVYPVSAFQGFGSYGWNVYQANSVPVPVITRPYYQ